MKLIQGIQNFKTPSKPVALTLGFFDGVHRGHKLLLDKLIEVTKEINGTSVVLTFDSHPFRVVAPHKLPPKIMTLTQRIEYLGHLGIDHVIVQPFDEKFAEISADDFLVEIIQKRIKASAIVGGYDCHFGKNRQGTLDSLRKFAAKNNYIFHDVPPLTINKSVVSSTAIRNAIENGDFGYAHELLGRPWTIRAIVVKGHGIGSNIGFPTANLDVTFLQLPAEGVYAAYATIGELEFNAIMYVGIRPTFNDNSHDIVCEVYVMGLSSDLYGKWVNVRPIHKIRDDIKFSSVEDLKAQIKLDVVETDKILNKT